VWVLSSIGVSCRCTSSLPGSPPAAAIAKASGKARCVWSADSGEDFTGRAAMWGYTNKPKA